MRFHQIILITLLSTYIYSQDETETSTDDITSTNEVDDIEMLEEALKDGYTQEFHADVHRVLDIIINSIYTEREIFIRELISNSSDASNKIRFMGITNDEVLGEGDLRNLDIKIDLDQFNKTITFTDKGLGMTKQQLVENLGTIAKSGTSNFVEKIKEAQASNSNDMIGQFGVGFYSVFLVAEKVIVTSKSHEPNEPQHIWKSDASGSFTVVQDPRGNTLGRGTSVKIYLRQDTLEFLKESRVEEVVKKYSKFVGFPVMLKTEVEKVRDEPMTEEEIQIAEEREAKEREEKQAKGEAVEEPTEPPARVKKVPFQDWEYKQINSKKPIWLDDPENIEDSEYVELYRQVTGVYDKHAVQAHFKAEGDINFNSVIFIRHLLRQSQNKDGVKDQAKTRINLYVKRVLIGKEFDDMLPFWMNEFICGVIDSDDLPLNVSRETINQTKVMKVISKKVTRKIIERLEEFADDQEKEFELDEEYKDDKDNELYKEEKKKLKEAAFYYYEFLKNYGDNIKQGMIHDSANRNKLVRLLRFKSTKSDEPISVNKYIKGMIEGQKDIYYISGDNIKAMKQNPLITKLENMGFEILLFDKPIDEFAFQEIKKYEDYTLTNVGAKFDLPETDVDKKKFEIISKDFKPLTKFLEEVLTKQVKNVKMSKILLDYPVAITSGEYGYSIHQEKIWRAQSTYREDQGFMGADKTLELNPHHEAIQAFLAKVQHYNDLEDEDEQKKKLKQECVDLGFIYLEMAYINASGQVLNAISLTKKLNRITNRNLGKDANAAYKEYVVEIPAEETDADNGDDVNLEDDEAPEDLDEVKGDL